MNDPVRGLVKFGRDTTMLDGTSVTALRVRIGPGTSVFDVFTNNLIGSQDAEIRGIVGEATLPLAEPFCELPEPVTCGGEEIDIADGETLTDLAPGTYGRVRVRNGSTLLLPQNGTYTFCSIKLGRMARLEATSAVARTDLTINIESKIQIGAGSFFGTTSGVPIVLNVAGRVVRVSQNAILNAAVIAPNGKFKIQRDGTLLGCFCAKASTTDKRVQLTCVE